MIIAASGTAAPQWPGEVGVGSSALDSRIGDGSEAEADAPRSRATSLASPDTLAPAPSWLASACTRIGGLSSADVWAVRIDACDPRFFLSHLLPDEARQIERYRNSADRQRSAVGKVMTRMILASRIGVLAGEVEIGRQPFGKPVVVCSSEPRPQVNVSHSGGLVVIAVADAPVGVDVEEIRPIPQLDSLLRDALSPEEGTHVRASDDPDLEFFRIWTAKESYLKATGEGIRALPDVSLTHLSSPVRRLLRGEVAASGWALQPFCPAPGHVASVCVERRHD